MGAVGQGVPSGGWVHPTLSFGVLSPDEKAPSSPSASEPEQLALKTLCSSSAFSPFSSLETLPPPILPARHLPPSTTGQKSNPLNAGRSGSQLFTGSRLEAGFRRDSGLGSLASPSSWIWLDFHILKEDFLITYEHPFSRNFCWSSVGKILGDLILIREKKKKTEGAFINFFLGFGITLWTR